MEKTTLIILALLANLAAIMFLVNSIETHRAMHLRMDTIEIKINTLENRFIQEQLQRIKLEIKK